MKEALEFLNKRGLNRFGIIRRDELPEDLKPAFADLPPGGSLILIGHGGRRFWEMAQAHWPAATKDPLDRLSKRWGEYFAQKAGLEEVEVLFPFGSGHRPLMRLARHLSMGFESPLMISIDPEFGLWTALRCLLWTASELEPSEAASGEHPCATCGPKPCLASCPVEAPALGGEMNRQACLEERLRAGSDCAMACLSRLACPYGAEHRYSEAQRRYHGERSLETLKKWREQGEV